MTTWISVEERLPEEHDSVWCYGRRYNGHGFDDEPKVWEAIYGRRLWWADGETVKGVTHWQLDLVPEPPEEAK